MANLSGTSGNDNLYGDASDDRIRTGGGTDVVSGGEGNDWVNCTVNADGSVSLYLYAGSANIYGGVGDDFLAGTTGSDIVLGGLGDDYINGLSGDDNLYGVEGNDVIYGDDGNDYLDGGVDNDTLTGGEGDDTVWGGEGDDRLDGGAGSDNLYSGLGNDQIDAGAGNDSLYGDAGNDTLIGGEGDDTVSGGDGDDRLDGGAGSDNLYSGLGNDQIDAGAGNDYLDGGVDNDTLTGGEGDDTVWGGEGDDRLDGGAGSDNLYSGLGNDQIDAGAGNDSLYGDAGNDTLIGGEGDDTVWGGEGDDRLDGGAGNDKLYGGASSNVLDGGAGNDSLYGDSGNDTLAGGTGFDSLRGGDGNDTYKISSRDFYLYDTAGTDTAVVSTSFVKIPDSIETVTYTNGAQALPYWLDAMLFSEAAEFSSLLGATKTMNFAFPAMLPSYNTSPYDALGYLPFNTQQKAFARLALGYISSVVDIGFVESSTAAAINTMTFANNTQVNSAGYASYPSSSLFGSDVLLSRDTPGNLEPLDGEYAPLVLIHEIGHGLGLKHPFSQVSSDGHIIDEAHLPTAEDNTTWTVMSYTNNKAQYHLAYSPLDIAALQYLYGPSKSARTGNDTYTLTASDANFVWDGAGVDTLSASGQTLPVTLYLEPGYWGFIGSKADTITAAGQVTVNFGTVIENLTGGSGSDTLYGNTTDNVIDGGLGSDLVTYAGVKLNYTITALVDGFLIQSTADGADTLKNVERVAFADQTITLAKATEPVASTYSPFKQAKNVAVGSDIVFTFNEDVVRGAGDILLKTASGTVIATYDAATSAMLKFSGHTLTINPSNDLSIFTDFKLEMPAGAVKDLAGNSHVGISDYTFSTQTLDSLYQFFVVAFSAAPGTAYMNQMADAYNYGLSVKEIVNIFTTKPQFTSTYALTLTNPELATLLVSNIVKNSATVATKAEAVRDIVAALDFGWTRGDMIYQVFGNLANMPLDDAKWGDTTRLFRNQTDVGRYFTEVMHNNSTELATLKAVVGQVTHTADVSTPEAIASLIGVALVGA